MKKFAMIAVAIASVMSSPALAATLIISGDTTAEPTYNRPLSGRPPTGLSAVGTAVRYVVTPFTVSASGNYNFLNSSVHDSFLGVHQNAFNPANGLLNALAYDDDAGPGSDSAITALGLISGVSYFAVSSGFANTDFGRFTLTISGPGDIVAGNAGVPEPASWAMMLFGFAGIGSALRRRGAATVTA